ncbi:unnamed protein product [Trifolium pratense]|uniref:Uncharacterized protein n=1 Tax=Trifolium pratense TaxID=57577 RepID=A0ACB0LUS1_TRIPR|nr:unnamed protein product [Trifolium pratense]
MRKKVTPSSTFHNPFSSYNYHDDNNKHTKINAANLQGSTRMYKCDLCSKSFSSGNALGGHKSSHKKQKTHHDDDNNEKQEHSCCQVCKKFFSSNKALYGHMRSHKRDGKKVIHPPPTISSSLEHNNDVDEDRFLLRESVLDLSNYFPQG